MRLEGSYQGFLQGKHEVHPGMYGEDAQKGLRGTLYSASIPASPAAWDLPPPSSAQRLPTLLSLGLKTDAGQGPSLLVQ